MKDLYAALFILLMIIGAISMSLGVNLRKWYGWAQVLSGFLLGLLMGQNIAGRLIFGVFFALVTLGLGPIVWRRLHH